MKKGFIIKEYCKYVMPCFNGYGVVIHEISGINNDCEPVALDHTFGQDESINPSIKLGSVEQAHKIFLNNKQPERSNEYSFIIASKQAFREKVSFTELRTNKYQPERMFRVFWDLSFGFRKEAKYLWGWLSPVMFKTMTKDGKQHSQVKIEYPTRRLVFKVFFHYAYPMYNDPELIMIDKTGKEQRIKNLKEVDVNKEEIGFTFIDKQNFKCFTATVNNPKIGHTYRVVWTIGYKKLAKYFGFLKAKK